MPEPASASADLARLRIDRGDETSGRGGGVARLGGAAVVLAVLAAGGWVAWDRFLKPLPVVKVWHVPASGSVATKDLDASGYLIPQRRAEVATKVAGIVKKVLVDEGDTVAEGQALAELANDTEEEQLAEARVAVQEIQAMRASAWKGLELAQAQIASARKSVSETDAGLPAAARALDEAAARREEAKKDYERRKRLFDSKDIGDAEFEAAEATWKAADSRWLQSQANVTMAEARKQQAESNVKTAESAAEVAKADAEAADARLKAAESRVKQANLRIEDMVIRSPIAGRVTARKIHPGEAASPAGIVTGTRGGALFTVADFSTLEAEVDINESRLSELRPKQAARISVDAVPSKKYRGELRQVVPTADRQRAVVKVRVRILDADAALLPEMGCRATFLEDASAPASVLPKVPREAIVRGGGGAAVWVVVEGRAKRRAVELGPEKDGMIEVTSGLSGGEVVVVSNAVPMEEGLKVKAEER